jgi:glyoxylase-like metal-dependent hydrolase (beta-lactamase superfamily II)
VDELFPGLRRVTFRLPLGIDHVHCYLLRASDGSWTLVDTGLGVDDPEAVWGPVLAELDAPITRIVITHMHPDHVGGARDAAAATGAAVLQGREDYEQCVGAWGPDRSPDLLTRYMVEHGMPAEDAGAFTKEGRGLASFVHWFEGPELLDAGDEVDGWRVEVLRGHADGHVVLLRDGVMIAGDVILGKITPAIGLYPRSRPDPLRDYFETLARVVELAPRLAMPGHGPVLEDVAERAREIARHHRLRLDAAARALGDEPLTAYDVSLQLFVNVLSPTQRRFALAESLAHLERLVHEGRAERAGANGYTAA